MLVVQRIQMMIFGVAIIHTITTKYLTALTLIAKNIQKMVAITNGQE
jgi:hypothetical protein